MHACEANKSTVYIILSNIKRVNRTATISVFWATFFIFKWPQMKTVYSWSWTVLFFWFCRIFLHEYFNYPVPVSTTCYITCRAECITWMCSRDSKLAYSKECFWPMIYLCNYTIIAIVIILRRERNKDNNLWRIMECRILDFCQPKYRKNSKSCELQSTWRRRLNCKYHKVTYRELTRREKRNAVFTAHNLKLVLPLSFALRVYYTLLIISLGQ